jgi:hypothetical protein
MLRTPRILQEQHDSHSNPTQIDPIKPHYQHGYQANKMDGTNRMAIKNVLNQLGRVEKKNIP